MSQPITPFDIDDLLVLNNAHAVETSLLDRAKLTRMIGMAFLARTVPSRQALMIAFDQSADHDSINFRWFHDRYPRFVYSDRIIVAAEARGGGVAREIYTELFTAARAAGHDMVAAEVNSMPPNPGSDAFHARLGFVEVGRGSPYPGKEVRYLAARV